MKVVKIIVGILAILWCLAHVAELAIRGLPTGEFAFSGWMGKLVALSLGAMVAVIAFRKPKAK